MAAKGIQIFRHVAAIVALTLLSAPTSTPAGSPDRRSLIITVDHSAEHAREITRLSQVVSDAADSQRRWVYAHTLSAGAEVTIGDVQRDASLVEELQARFAKRAGVLVNKTPARSFWITYAPGAAEKYGEDALRKRSNRLEDTVLSLRTPLPGVVIEAQSDGALVRSNSPGFEELLKKHLMTLFVVERRSSSTWHVAWNPEYATKHLASRPVESMLRFFLAEPLDLLVLPYPSGAVFTVTEPDRYSGFIEAVRKAFAHDDVYRLGETPSVIFRVERTDVHVDTDALLPHDVAFELVNEISELANPSVDVIVIGDEIWAHAKNSAHNADRSAIIQSALAGRGDLIITPQTDGSVKIRLSPDAHLYPPAAPVDAVRLANAIKSLALSLQLRQVSVVSIGPERAQATFSTDTDAALFKRVVRNVGRLAVRLVDEPWSNDDSPTAPSPGDERLPTAQGKFVWVKPGTVLDGEMIAEAKAEENRQTEQTVIAIRLTDEGRSLFAATTRQHINDRIAIVIDGVVITAPVVREPIEGGEVEIEGNFTAESATALAKAIVQHPTDIPLKIEDGHTAH